MRAEISVVFRYIDENNIIRDYHIYYNSDNNKFTSYDGCICWLNVNENGDIIICFEDDNGRKGLKTIKNTCDIHIMEEFKSVLKDNMLIRTTTKTPFDIKDVAFERKSELESEKQSIKETLRDALILSDDLIGKYYFLNNSQASFEDIIGQIARYNIYIKENSSEYKEQTENRALDYLCIGIMALRNGELDYFRMFEVKPKVINTLISIIKDRDTEEILAISNHIINNRSFFNNITDDFSDKDFKIILEQFVNNYGFDGVTKKNLKKVLTILKK